ncbi:hypothetical protein [uncultured Desulfobacter sp.]|uniref:hypothetical protein n=1 Tax=uncultured Desulfobacter sp. TaxID=240139 RepID=UPI002AA660A9|nr:hypothetical protein [uncultured Desulfobacter sp.]
MSLSSIQKRLRDINLLGYWTLKAVFIPGFGQLFLLGLYFIPSSNGKRNMRLPIWNWKEGKIEYTAPDKTEQENSS